jgi:hypothetical protein
MFGEKQTEWLSGETQKAAVSHNTSACDFLVHVISKIHSRYLTGPCIKEYV